LIKKQLLGRFCLLVLN